MAREGEGGRQTKRYTHMLTIEYITAMKPAIKYLKLFEVHNNGRRKKGT